MANKLVVTGSGITREALDTEAVELLASISGVIQSKPPSTYHKIYNLYAQKVGDKYQLYMEVESEPEP